MAINNLFRRKALSAASVESEHSTTGLKRTLSAFDLTMLGIGAIVGAGLFSSIKGMIVGAALDSTSADSAVLGGAGPAVMLSFLLTGLACGFAALCYAEIASMVPVAGSAYTYSYVAFGEIIAWIIGWDLIIEYAIGNIYVAHSWGDYLLSLLDNFNIHIPIWMTRDFQTATNAFADATQTLAKLPEALKTLADAAADAVSRDNAQTIIVGQDGARQLIAAWEHVPRIGGYFLSFNFPSAFITIVLTVLLVRGVKESARTNAVMVGLKLILVAAFIAIGFSKLNTSNWHPFAKNGFSGIWQGAALGFFAYIGFDAVSTAGEEAKNPQRDLPRGMIWSLLICTALYVATAAALTGMMPYDAIKAVKGSDPLAAALNYVGFTNASAMLSLGAVIAMTAVLLVFQLGQTRIFYVMARDGLLPKVFSRVHPKYRTPHINTWVTGIFVAVMCSLLTDDQALRLCNIGTLFAFFLVSIGVIALRTRNPGATRPFRVPGYPVTPVISALACVGLMLGLGMSSWLRFGIWLAIGLVIYAFYGYRKSRLRAGA
jgi:APA family basic amino acid/polyamine antiporter